MTWRDIQHLIVHTSHKQPLQDNVGWYTNAAGIDYNHRFGFGLINANEMVKSAFEFENVGQQEKCTIPIEM